VRNYSILQNFVFAGYAYAFLGAFAFLLEYLGQCFCQSVWNNSWTTIQIFMVYDIAEYYEQLLDNLNFHFVGPILTTTCVDQHAFLCVLEYRVSHWTSLLLCIRWIFIFINHHGVCSHAWNFWLLVFSDYSCPSPIISTDNQEYTVFVLFFVRC
jgi:hypothetical protein